jgi:hypothetical protein
MTARKPKAARKTKRPLPPRNGKQKTIEELAAEQGIDPRTQFTKALGAGKGLWRSDEEFEQFLAGIYERRRQDRGQ